MQDSATCPSDHSFGPAVRGCRGDFDFTLLFEDAILSVTPSVCFIVLATWQIIRLYPRPNLHLAPKLLLTKLAFITVLLALDLALVALFSRLPSVTRAWNLAAAACETVVAGCLFALSALTHDRTAHPSTLLSLYLALTTLFDIARTRTQWFLHGGSATAILFTVRTVWKAVLLAVESLRKQERGRLVSQDKSTLYSSPEETSGIFSLALLAWLNPLIWVGSRRILVLDDLGILDRRISSDNPIEGVQKWPTTTTNSAGSIGLLWFLMRSVGWSLLQPIPARLLLIGFSFCQPFFIQRLTQFTQSSQTTSKASGIGMIGAAILIYTGLAVSTSMYWYAQYRVLTRLWGSLSITIFDNSLCVAEIDDSCLTVMSTDVSRVYGGLHNIHELWANTVEVAIAAWLLQRQIGTAFVTPIVIVVVCVGLSSCGAKFAGKWQGAWSAKTQHRVKVTSSTIAQVRQIEASGRATHVASLLNRLRGEELDAGARFRLLGVFSTCVAFAPMLLSPLITFATTNLGNQLDAPRAYAALAYLTLLTSPLSQLFQTVPMMMASTASVQRILNFTRKPHRHEHRIALDISKASTSDDVIRLSGLSVGWCTDKMILKELALAFRETQLSVILGPVGSGKSTLCKAILGDLPCMEGQIEMSPQSLRQIAYCEQDPFLVDGSIRTNIVALSAFDTARYRTALWATMLDIDIASLPDLDDTKVGSTGTSLSGGQKQRVALARALYMDADVYMLDDSLNGVDLSTSKTIEERLFGTGGLLASKTVIWTMHSAILISMEHQIITLDKAGYATTTQSPRTKHSSPVQPPAFVHARIEALPAKDEKAEIRVRHDPISSESKQVEILRNRHDKRVYTRYLEAISAMTILILASSGILFSFSYNFGSVWISYWVRNSFDRPASNIHAFYFGLYALFQVFGMVTLAVFVGIIGTVMSRQAGRHLHERAIACLFKLPLSYFTTTDTGTRTALFSQDIGMVDNGVSFGISNTLLSGLAVAGQLVVVSAATPFVAIGYPFLFAVLYGLQNYYLKTSRQLRLLELEAKAPLYSKFQSLVRGCTSIRAFGWSQNYRKTYRTLLDAALQPFYLLDLVQQWLALCLNFIVAVIAVAVTCFVTQTGSASHVGLVGAGLVSLMTLGELGCATVRSWTQLETSLGAVKRLEDLQNNLPQGDTGSESTPSANWPSHGHIQFRDVSIIHRQASQDHTILADVNLEVTAGEKIAIVGRTGSGKSSLQLLLLRLLDPASGTVSIDNVPLAQLDRACVRQRIWTVSQDPVFLGGDESAKQLLDPDGLLSDEQCETILIQVGLSHVVGALGGLHTTLSSDRLSHGERQLMGIATLLARKLGRESHDGNHETTSGGVVLLDEATSSLDHESQKTMVRLIFGVFSKYTVIWNTHSTEFLNLFDRVYQIQNGKIAAREEFAV